MRWEQQKGGLDFYTITQDWCSENFENFIDPSTCKQWQTKVVIGGMKHFDVDGSILSIETRKRNDDHFFPPPGDVCNEKRESCAR